MNSKILKLARDFEMGRISARQYSRKMARVAIRKGRVHAEIDSRNDRRYR